jgi:hypothetical protein
MQHAEHSLHKAAKSNVGKPNAAEPNSGKPNVGKPNAGKPNLGKPSYLPLAFLIAAASRDLLRAAALA